MRGYGLVDSPKVRAKPGQQLNLTAVPAPNERAAAQYYPAIYWYAMMKMPPEKDFGGSSEIPKNITRETWRQRMGNVDCIGCHQLGQESTRTVPAQFGEFKTGAEAWMRRVSSGQTGEFMVNRLAGQLGGAPFKYFGDWTDRVAKGELPKDKPQRPQGVERNVVVTSWEWGTEKSFIHDLISSDRRYPTVNAYGPLYGSNEYSSDDMPILDPKTHKVTFFKMSVADPNAPESFGPPFHASAVAKPTMPSAYWGDEKIWNQRANNHNGMFDKSGRVWFAAAVRATFRRVKSLLRHHSDRPKLFDRSSDLEIHRGRLPAILFQLIFNLLPLIERAQPSALDSGDMNKHISAAALRSILVTRAFSLILRTAAISLSPSQNSSSMLTLVLRPAITMEYLLTELLPCFTVLRITRPVSDHS